MKTIGILGGIGPEASADFYSRFVELFKKRFQPKGNTDFPRIIINSISPEDLISGENEHKLNFYIEGLRFLEQESDLICIVCNTAYNYYELLQEKISKPILDLPRMVKKSLGDSGARTVTIFGTPTSKVQNLYVFSEFNYNFLSNEEVERLGEIIGRRVIGDTTDQDRQYCVDLFNKYANLSDKIVVACTELALILKDLSSDKKIDPMDLLLEELLNSENKSV